MDSLWYVKLNVILWLRAGRPLYFSNNGVVLAHCDVEPTYLDISVDEPQPRMLQSQLRS